MIKTKQYKKLMKLLDKADDKYGCFNAFSTKKATDGAKKELCEFLLKNNIIVLPVKEGTTVYEVVPKCTGGIDCPFNGGYGLRRCKDNPTKCKAYIKEIEFNISLFNYIDVSIFTTKEKAEQVRDRLNRKEV